MKIIRFLNHIYERIIQKMYCFFRIRIKEKDVTLLSNNCIAAFLYEDLNAEYKSPTIGLQIPIKDFIKYVNNIEYYHNAMLEEHSPFQKEFEEVGGKREIDFPCGLLGSDIRIMFQHEKEFLAARNKWQRRSQRINKDKIFVICCLTDDLIDQEVIDGFNSIKYKKILLSNKKIDIKESVVINCPKGKKWFHKDKYIRYFEKLNWRKILSDI